MVSNVIDDPYREFEHSGWERAAPSYAGSFEAATRLFVFPLLESVGIRKHMDLLDVACGTGLVASLAAEHGAAAIGVDFSSKMIAAAGQRYPGLQFHEADAEALPFPDGVFDAVVINFGVHHFPFPLRALSEAHRVLCANGCVAFTVWAAPDEHSLHKITLGALREAGVSGAALPTAPGGVVNDIASCLDLLRMSGFSVPHSRAEKIVASLWLDSEQHLIDMLVDGTVRMSTLIRTQTREKTAAIVAAIRIAAAAYRENGRLRIPVTAILAVGSKA